MNGERSNGGITSTQPREPPNWVPYFAVESLDGALAAAADAGGETLAGPITMPAGQIAEVSVLEGAPPGTKILAFVRDTDEAVVELGQRGVVGARDEGEQRLVGEVRQIASARPWS